MEIVLADAAGFCFGVQRALDVTAKMIQEAAPGTPIHTLGPLIHNPQVVAKLRAQGVEVLKQPGDAGSGVVIVRSHGIAPLVMQELIDQGCEVIDATCPFVQRAMNWAKQLKEEGYQVIIVGDRLHPEVQAILGYTDETAQIVSTPQEVQELPIARRVGIIAQTTQSVDTYRACVCELIGKVEELKTFDTICTATEQRQRSAGELAAQVDVMVVIGGRNSANTRRLAELCQERGAVTHHIETADELQPSWFSGVHRAGVTAGASTPDWLIEGVLTRMREFSEEKVAEAAQEQAVEETIEVTLDEQKEAKAAETMPESVETEAEEAVEEEATETEAKNGEEVAETDTVDLGAPAGEEARDEKAEMTVEEENGAAEEGENGEEAEQVQAEAAEEEVEAEVSPEFSEEEQQEDAVQNGEEEAEEDEEDQLSELQMSDYDLQMPTVGAIISGTVIQVSADEVLVNIDYKSEGRIPLNELSFISDAVPEDVVSVGDEIFVKVLKVDDAEGNVVLSKRRADADQSWEKLEQLYKAGESLEAKVIQVVKGGLLVNVGVRGFIPASHVSRGFEDNLQQYIGQELELKIIELDRSKNNVVFSHKEVLEERYQQAKEEAFSTLEKGTKVPGIVRRLTDFGAFVDIGNGVEGLLHVSEMAYSRVNHPSDVVSEGEEITVMVLGVDRDRERISLGLKQTMPDPWTKVSEHYHVGDRVEGEVTRVVDFGAFVKLEDGVEGLVHISELSHKHIAKAEDAVQPGEQVEVKVISVDAQARRIGLSIKELEAKPAPKPAPKAKREELLVEGADSEELTTNLGDMFGDLFKESEEDQEQEE